MPLLLLPSAPFSISGKVASLEGPQLVSARGNVAITSPLQTIIPSYAYQQYADDASIVAFIAAYNTLAQSYLTWFNQTPLAVYTNLNVSGALLDWIASGIYGVERPVFSSGLRKFIAGTNTAPLNTMALNGSKLFSNQVATIATDDYFRRVLTWYFYVGNGRRFSVPMLRQRVARFLYGVNGGDVTLSQAQSVSIQPELVGYPPLPALSTVLLPQTLIRIAGLNSTPLNSAPLNGSRKRIRGTYGPLAGLNSLPLNGFALNIGRMREIKVWVTFQTPVGETLPSPGAAIKLPGNKLLLVYSPAATPSSTRPRHVSGLNSAALNTMALNGQRFKLIGNLNQSGVIGWNVYTAAQRGISTKHLTAGLNSSALNRRALNASVFIRTTPLGQRQNLFPIPIGTNWTEPESGFVRGPLMPTKNTSNTPGNFIITVPSGAAATFFQQALAQNILPLPFQISAETVIH